MGEVPAAFIPCENTLQNQLPDRYKITMTSNDKKVILNELDNERQTVLYPGMTRVLESGVIRDLSADGKSGEIVYSSCSPDQIDFVIQREIVAAREAGYDLEWKVYGHDQPANLRERLVAAGFETDDEEQFMVCSATSETLERFGKCHSDIWQITDRNGLRDVQAILEDVRGASCARQIEEYASLLESHPATMSLYVAYVDSEPAACGRIYFHPDSKFGALYGGQTREQFRKRGLFTAVVAARIREALARGVRYICVDALPTSEPILRKRGFEIITSTQPFNLSG